jgi:hypothetical protein
VRVLPIDQGPSAQRFADLKDLTFRPYPGGRMWLDSGQYGYVVPRSDVEHVGGALSVLFRIPAVASSEVGGTDVAGDAPTPHA